MVGAAGGAISGRYSIDILFLLKKELLALFI
jgi:hypothetical protein